MRFREVRETPLERIERNLPNKKSDNLDWLPDEIVDTGLNYEEARRQVNDLPDEITF